MHNSESQLITSISVSSKFSLLFPPVIRIIIMEYIYGPLLFCVGWELEWPFYYVYILSCIEIKGNLLVWGFGDAFIVYRLLFRFFFLLLTPWKENHNSMWFPSVICITITYTHIYLYYCVYRQKPFQKRAKLNGSINRPIMLSFCAHNPDSGFSTP